MSETLRCYCCGEPIDVKAPFALVAIQPPADRVFVMLPEHVEKIDSHFADGCEVITVTA